MRRFLTVTAIVLMALSTFSIPVSARPDYLSIMPSIQLLGPVGCTAFSINQAKGYWMTARHCIISAESETQWTILDRPARVKAESLTHDMVVLESYAKAPALKLHNKMPRIGDEVMLAGYAWGQRPLLFFWGHIMYPKLAYGYEPAPGIMWLDVALVHGMSGPGNSGSPVFTADGLKVVGLHVGGTREVPIYGVMVPWDELREFAGSFWGR